MPPGVLVADVGMGGGGGGAALPPGVLVADVGMGGGGGGAALRPGVLVADPGGNGGGGGGGALPTPAPPPAPVGTWSCSTLGACILDSAQYSPSSVRLDPKSSLRGVPICPDASTDGIADIADIADPKSSVVVAPSPLDEADGTLSGPGPRPIASVSSYPLYPVSSRSRTSSRAAWHRLIHSSSISNASPRASWLSEPSDPSALSAKSALSTISALSSTSR